MSYRQVAAARSLPPVEFDDLGKAEIGDQIGNMRGNDNGRCHAARPQVVLHQGTQGWSMEMIEVSVRDQYRVDRRQISDAESGTAKALQHEQPAREVRIDDDSLPADLYKETGVTNEGDAEFSVGGEAPFVGLTGARSDGGVAHQTSKLGGAFPNGRIAKCLLNHPATEPGGSAGSSLSPFILVRIAARAE